MKKPIEEENYKIDYNNPKIKKLLQNTIDKLNKFYNVPCNNGSCKKEKMWIKSTQFSGDFEYCDKCAPQQKDFGKEDPSYFYWIKKEEWLKLKKKIQAKK